MMFIADTSIIRQKFSLLEIAKRKLAANQNSKTVFEVTCRTNIRTYSDWIDVKPWLCDLMQVAIVAATHLASVSNLLIVNLLHYQRCMMFLFYREAQLSKANSRNLSNVDVKMVFNLLSDNGNLSAVKRLYFPEVFSPNLPLFQCMSG